MSGVASVEVPVLTIGPAVSYGLCRPAANELRCLKTRAILLTQKLVTLTPWLWLTQLLVRERLRESSKLLVKAYFSMITLKKTTSQELQLKMSSKENCPNQQPAYTTQKCRFSTLWRFPVAPSD